MQIAKKGPFAKKGTFFANHKKKYLFLQITKKSTFFCKSQKKFHLQKKVLFLQITKKVPFFVNQKMKNLGSKSGGGVFKSDGKMTWGGGQIWPFFDDVISGHSLRELHPPPCYEKDILIPSYTLEFRQDDSPGHPYFK